MFYKDWEPIYRKITKDFNFPERNEKKAANVLEKLLQHKNLFPLKNLENLIADREVFIFGAGPSLETALIKHKKDFSNKLKIAADGATTALLKYNVQPDIIVTDLDGKVIDQIKANSQGRIAIIHAHGDNIPRIKKYVPEFKDRIVGTIQIDPKPYKNVYNFGGFTDGDRAVFLAHHFHAKKISLLGFDFNDKIGKYSFSKDKNLKLKKLKWCKYLIEQLTKLNQNVFYLL